MSLVAEIRSRFQYEFIARIIGTTSGAILTIGLTRILTPDSYGLLFLSLSIFGVAMLFSRLGIPKSGARYITKYREKDRSQIPNIIQFTFLLNLGSALVVSLVLFLGHDFLAELVKEPRLASFLAIGSIFVFFMTLFKLSRFILQSFEDIRNASIIYSFERAGRVVFALSIALLGYGALGAFTGYIIASVSAALMGITFIYFYHYRGKESRETEDGLWSRIAVYTVPLTATSAANTIDKKIDTVLVGFFIDPVAVAFYTLARQIVGFVQAPISALGFSLSPTFEAQKNKGNSATAARLYEETLSYVLLLYFPAAAGISLIARPFIQLVFGPDYIGAVPVIRVLSPYIVLLSVAILTSNSLDYLGRARGRAIAKGITASMNFILNLILIPVMGVVGAALSTVMTFSLYTISTIYIMSFEFELRWNWLARKIAAIIVVTGTMSVIIYGLIGFVEGLVTLVGVIMIGVCVWGLSSLAFGLIDMDQILQTN